MNEDNKQIVLLVIIVIILILFLVGLILFFGIKSKTDSNNKIYSESTSVVETVQKETTSKVEDKVIYNNYYNIINTYFSNDSNLISFKINDFKLYDKTCENINYGLDNYYFVINMDYNSNGHRINENDTFLEGTMNSNIIVEISNDNVTNIYSKC